MIRITVFRKTHYYYLTRLFFLVLVFFFVEQGDKARSENPHHAFDGTVYSHHQLGLSQKSRRFDITGQSHFINTLILNWTNEERKRRRIILLKLNPLLSRLALIHSRNQANAGIMGHNSTKFPNGWQTFEERTNKLITSGPAAYGENVFWTSAKLPLTCYGLNDYAQKIVQAWMSSPGHRQNILNPKFTYVGISFYNGYVTQLFSSRDVKY